MLVLTELLLRCCRQLHMPPLPPSFCCCTLALLHPAVCHLLLLHCTAHGPAVCRLLQCSIAAAAAVAAALLP
jgi:hypothetical protein